MKSPQAFSYASTGSSQLVRTFASFDALRTYALIRSTSSGAGSDSSGISAVSVCKISIKSVGLGALPSGNRTRPGWSAARAARKVATARSEECEIAAIRARVSSPRLVSCVAVPLSARGEPFARTSKNRSGAASTNSGSQPTSLSAGIDISR